MFKMVKNVPLLEFFSIPDNYFLNEERYNYYSSLIPEISTLEKCRKITFVVSLKYPQDKDKERLGYNNATNPHIFKPKFYADKDRDAIVCYVASMEVLNHTLRALSIFCKLQLKINPLVSFYSLNLEVDEIIQNWVVNDLILIGRVDSVINFLRLFYLFEEKKLDFTEVKRIFVALEKIRLGNYIYNHNKLNSFLREKEKILDEIDRRLYIEKLNSCSPYIMGVNFKYRDKKITCVQLPWGFTLAKTLLSSLFRKNEKIKKIAIVGGVGYVGSHLHKVSVDDVFIPEGIVLGNDLKGYKEKIIKNNALLYKNKYFSYKKICRGFIKTVTPRVGIVSNTKDIREGIKKGIIDSIDMELEGFLEVIGRYPFVSFFSSYYIMDIPAIGLGLGNTYYNIYFIKKLFSSFERGKYVCLEKALRFLAH